jgi:hypothetical protein
MAQRQFCIKNKNCPFARLNMDSRISVLKAGLVVAALYGAWHLCWSILVALGLAQPLIDFVFWMHFIKPVYVIESFAIGRAAILLVITTGVGFVIGSIFALIWNALHRT